MVHAKTTWQYSSVENKSINTVSNIFKIPLETHFQYCYDVFCVSILRSLYSRPDTVKIEGVVILDVKFIRI